MLKTVRWSGGEKDDEKAHVLEGGRERAGRTSGGSIERVRL